MLEKLATRIERRLGLLRRMRERLRVARSADTPGAAFWSACAVRRCAFCAAASTCEQWLSRGDRPHGYRGFCPNAHELDLESVIARNRD